MKQQHEQPHLQLVPHLLRHQPATVLFFGIDSKFQGLCCPVIFPVALRHCSCVLNRKNDILRSEFLWATLGLWEVAVLENLMPSGRHLIMDLTYAYDAQDTSYVQGMHHDLWPLDEVDLNKGKFPCCLVWAPFPIVSWLAPFIGHVGICREDGVVLDFSGSNFVNVDDFAFGPVARYFQLERAQCCLPPNLTGHTCNYRFGHSEFETAITWDDALRSSASNFENKSYNLFTCNCHSFVANCLNRLCYGGSVCWNMINVAALVLFWGQWVNYMSILRSFLPFTVVLCFGLFMVGWPFLIGLLSFSVILAVWFVMGTYCIKTLLEF